MRLRTTVLMIAIVAVFAVMASGAFAATDYYVDKTYGSDGNSGTSWGDAFATIQKGINSCNTGSSGDPDIVHVAANTYYENIVLDSYVTLLGGYPPGGGDRDSDANETIIDGGAADSVVTISSKTSVTIDGFTIQNGHSEYGGGIYCSSSSPTLTSCTISDNTAGNWGGGIYCDDSSPAISNCVITQNNAVNGGGICFHIDSSGAFVNNVIAGNAAQERGGGVYCSEAPEVVFALCTISENTGNYGGGICICNSSPKVIYSILWDNSPQEIYASGLSFVEIIYFCVQGGWSGQGNIDEDPLFVPLSDAPYYLAHDGPQAANSPCIDAGVGWLDDFAEYGLTSAHTTCTDGREDGDDDADALTGPIDMGYHYPEAYDGQGDTSINLTSFEARPAGSAILVTWETGAEIDNAGFALFREIAGTQDYLQISDLIPGLGTLASGASYTFTDTGVEPGITYNYWLVDIETSGEWTAHGPASATATGATHYLEPLDSGMVMR